MSVRAEQQLEAINDGPIQVPQDGSALLGRHGALRPPLGDEGASAHLDIIASAAYHRCTARPCGIGREAMRTTLDVDDEVLAAVRSLASQRGQTMGRVISDLARSALAPQSAGRVRNGVPLFRPRPGRGPATMELVNALRDGEQEP
jgi:hypothetical protein